MRKIFKRRPEVAILVETSTSWGRQIVRGICDYAFRNGGWHFYLEPRGRYEDISLPAGWQGDGVIGRITSEKMASQLITMNIAVINVSCYEFGENVIPICTCDEPAIGVMAAEHLMGRGLKNFAYFCDALRRHYEDRLGQSFMARLAENGFRCDVFKSPMKLGQAKNWENHRELLETWLMNLPKPTGLLAWNDVRGRQITEACRHCNIKVPEDIAVIGGGMDELLGDISFPPLTTIDPSAKQVGFQAALILDRMMKGKFTPPAKTLIKPAGIIEKQSTNILAVDDAYLAKALSFIRENALKNIEVEDVVKQVPLSRRGLEHRFQEKLGISPLQEIRRIRMEHARNLLINTYWPVAKIAYVTGYASSEIFTRAFTQYYRQSPLACRKANYL